MHSTLRLFFSFSISSCWKVESYFDFVAKSKSNLRLLCQDAQIEKEKQVYNVTGGCTALTVVYLLGKLYVANAGDSRCVTFPISVWDENRDSKRIKRAGYITALLAVVCVRRAIIIRNNEIVPMSSEFTPESERQRLQFLVRDLI